MALPKLDVGSRPEGASAPFVALVVDDSPEAAAFLNEALEARGMRVLVALSGEAALGIVAQVTPDVVLMDAVMPGLDGFETCRRLKQIAALRDVPVIFMTGLSETEHIVRAFEVGGVDYVNKPIVLEQLLARMDVHRANAHLTRSARLALDTTGRFLLAVDLTGRVLWATPQAEALLRCAAEHAPNAPLARIAVGPDGVRYGGVTTSPVELENLGQTGPNEILLRVSELRGNDADTLSAALKLTRREAEVLMWICRGKTNRDVGDILSLSPRTIDKHSETIFRKLGVDNRTSAVALAMQHLGPT